MSENIFIGFLCLHGFRGLLVLDWLGLVGANAHKALELFHEDEHQHCVRTVTKKTSVSLLLFVSGSRESYASLSHAGDHPLMRKLIPSFWYESAKILLRLGLTPLMVGAL
jgi:hypothetical protein